MAANPLQIFSDNSETVRYNISGLPLYSRTDQLKRYGYAAVAHWHPDLEFTVVISGVMQYFINGVIVTIQSGNGIFVNSRRIHYGFSATRQDSTFTATLVHPRLLTAQVPVAQEYLESRTSDSNLDYVLLSPRVDWQRAILEQVRSVNTLAAAEKADVLRLINEAARLGVLVLSHVRPQSSHPVHDPDWNLFWTMSRYIQMHYALGITIADIAEAAHIGRNKTFGIFRKFTGLTPNAYLINTRISTSITMLEDGTASVAEIAGRCGFSTPSHYAHTFKRINGMTPREYRKAHSTGFPD